MGEDQIHNQALRQKDGEDFKLPLTVRFALGFYQLLWSVAIPLLGCNARLKHGWQQRTVQAKPEKADLWIQAASVGEAYLARELVRNLNPDQTLRILITTNTNQGMEILEKISTDIIKNNRKLTLQKAYFPFDKPSLMAKALKAVQPKLLLLLESEIWPGLLTCCREQGTKILIANGRMTPKSLSRYLIWPTFWKSLSPDLVLAMSEDDAARFASLFSKAQVDTMSNIKFDRMVSQQETKPADNPLRRLIAPDARFIVLGSTRRQEEEDITRLIRHIRQTDDQIIIGLFPRHMHRIKKWQTILTAHSLPCQLRSQSSETVKNGTIVLWDTMGELTAAYELAQAAFVGGSLPATLGGQNFLEPLTCGLRPVTGPHWSDFSWVGREIFDKKMVYEAGDWQEAASLLLENVNRPQDRTRIRKMLEEYVRLRKGGAKKTCRAIYSLIGVS
ncbi:MAG: hypothetical protein KQH63_22070 [Desulfobulbaceae bacterium]|nr:hypothetical protein [Desulfobulbaceae bacterium]